MSVAGRLDPHGIERELGVPRCVVLERVGSVLDTAHEMAEQGAPHGTMIVADEQTAGRGRYGRAWASPPGGLWLAMVLRVADRMTPAMVSLRVGLALANTIVEVGRADTRVGLKWPNDVMLDDKKVAGILCESRWHGDVLQWVAVGIGVNLRNPLPEDLRQRATGLGAVHRLDVLRALVPSLLRLADQEPALSDRERRHLAELDWLRGRQIRHPAAGVVRGIAEDGSLVVDVAGTVQAIHAGTVELA